MIRNLDVRLAVAVILSLILSACGSDSNSTAEVEPDPVPKDIPCNSDEVDKIDSDSITVDKKERALLTNSMTRSVVQSCEGAAVITPLQFASEFPVLDANYRSRIRRSVQGPDGHLCYIAADIDDEGYSAFPSEWHSAVECIKDDLTGFRYERQCATDPEWQHDLKDIVFNEEGNLVVTELVQVERTGGENKIDWFYLQFTEMTVAGEVIKTSILEDESDARETRYYEYDSDGKAVTCSQNVAFEQDGKPLLIDLAQVETQWVDGSLYMMAYTYGVKMYKLDSDFNVDWDVQVMPAYTWLWGTLLTNSSSFTVTDSGDVYVAFELYGSDSDIYEQHFLKSLPNKQPKGSVGISVVNSDGVIERTFAIGEEAYSESLTDIKVADDKLWLGASVRHSPNASGSNSEWDLLLMSADLETGETLSYHLIDHNKEDLAYDFLLQPNGQFAFAGITGFHQADSNSQTSDGNGLILEVNSLGEVINQTEFDLERDTYITGFSMDGDSFIYDYVFDGPITHTCDAEANKLKCGSKASIGRYSF